MAKVPTERVTVRLSKMHLSTIDALVEAQQIRNRTHAIADAVRDWVNKKATEVKQITEAATNQLELQKTMASIQRQQADLNRLRQK